MKGRYCVKCTLILFMSAGLTFHFVKLWAAPNRQHFLSKTENEIHLEESLGWVVLPGNVTIYGGKRNNEDVIPLLTDAKNLCRNFQDGRAKLLLFIPSSIDHFEQRKAIRETWGLRALQQALNFRVAFILGVLSNDSTVVKKIGEEYHRFGDIVQIDLLEEYRNLGHKTLAGLRWSSAYCASADFVMKADDDLLIQIPNLMLAIQSSDDSHDLLLCRQNQRSKILRENMDLSLPWLSKYQVAETELPGKFYPPYCSGMTYVFSKAVRDKLLQACSTIPVFFIEDVYLTGFCRHKAGVRITPHPGISLSPPMTPDQAICAFKDGRLTSQELKPNELRRFWDGINTQGFFCPELLGYVRTQNDFPEPREKRNVPTNSSAHR